MNASRQKRATRFTAFIFLFAFALGTSARPQTASSMDPLPSWNEGATKRGIVDFVQKVTKNGGADFVPVEERIATFDNDGTLTAEALP